MQQTIEREVFTRHFVPRTMGRTATSATVTPGGRKADGVGVLADVAPRARIQRAPKRVGRNVLLRVASTLFWAVMGEKTFARAISQKRIPAALLDGALAAGTAYVQDVRRANSASEPKVSKRSVFSLYTAIGLGLGLGAAFVNRRR